jgi:hypothetical protein
MWQRRRSSTGRMPPCRANTPSLRQGQFIRGDYMLEIANLSHTYANGTVALDDVNVASVTGG